MTRSKARSCGTLVLASAILLIRAAPGWSGDGERAMTADEWCGFAIRVAEPWERSPLRKYTVPGAIRCAWAGPNGSSIVVFLQEPGAALSPRELLDGSVKVHKDQLDATVSAEEVRTVGGMQAMWMVVAAKGNGGAIDGKGSISTAQHWVAVPRQRDVVVILLSCPEADYPRLRESFEAAVASLTLSGSQTAAQKAAR